MAKFIRSELSLNPKVYKKLERKKQNEKIKEHLYLKWKLYAVALGTIVIITSTGLGVSLGVPWHEIFSNLNHLKLNKTAITGKENMTAEDAFNAVLANNTKISDLKTNVELISFIAPSYTSTGSLTIKAKADGKYNGNVKIKITTIKQINLKDLNLDPAITGKVNMSKEDAFQTFLDLNSTITDLKNNVESGTFTTPTYTQSGSLAINATPTGKYSGNITVTITKLAQTNLKDLDLTTTLTQPYTNKQDTFQAFLSINKNIIDLENNVETGTFKEPTYTQSGSLAINATPTGKYSGNIIVTVPKIKQTNLSNLELNKTISGTENMKAEDVFNEFISNNSTITDLKNNVQAGTFKEPTYTINGSLVINAIPTGKYSGNITVTITKLAQTNLKDLDLTTTLTQPYTNKENTFNAFLNLNQAKYPDLKNNVETGTFKEPTYTQSGSLVINATPTGKYTGTITVTVPKIKQTNLSNLELNKTISGTENMRKNDAFQAFLNANKNIADLDTNVQAGTFKAPTYTESGSLAINATPTGKYTGTITITITKLTQTNLKDLDLTTTLTQPYTNKQDAFNAFLSINQTKYTDLKNNVEAGTFKAPTYTESGSLAINATPTGKYSGNITVTITKLTQTNLATLNLNKIISGTENMTQDDAINAFLNLNQEKYSDLKDNIEAGTFKAPTLSTTGSLIINAKPDGKYSGSIEITITKLVINEEQQIVNAINQAPYWTQTVIGSSTESITNIIKTDTFIKGPLSNKIRNAFKIKSFRLNKITINGNELKNSDLKEVNTINAKINYNYGSIINQETNLTIDIIDPNAITDKQVVDAISSMTFDAYAHVDEKMDEFYDNVFNKTIDKIDYIEGQMNNNNDQISKEVKNIYKNRKSTFKFIKLTLNGETLTDEYLKYTQAEVMVKFIYNFGSFKNQEVNLRFWVVAKGEK